MPPGLSGARRGASDIEWVRPLLPDGIPAAVEQCSLNRVVRQATGTTSWVARYYGDLSSRVSPKEYPGTKMEQKTRTVTYTGVASEHAAFRETLSWLWRRHIIHTEGARWPSEARKAVGTLVDGVLQPCADCGPSGCETSRRLQAGEVSRQGGRRAMASESRGGRNAATSELPPQSVGKASVPKPKSSPTPKAPPPAAPATSGAKPPLQRCLLCGEVASEGCSKAGGAVLCKRCCAVDASLSAPVAGRPPCKLVLDAGEGWS